MFDSDAAMRWSQTTDVQARKKASTYSYQRKDGSFVGLSTARLLEEPNGWTYDGGDILPTGFLVYPGAKPAATIKDAIAVASKIPEGHRIKQ